MLSSHSDSLSLSLSVSNPPPLAIPPGIVPLWSCKLDGLDFKSTPDSPFYEQNVNHMDITARTGDFGPIDQHPASWLALRAEQSWQAKRKLLAWRLVRHAVTKNAGLTKSVDSQKSPTGMFEDTVARLLQSN